MIGKLLLSSTIFIPLICGNSCRISLVGVSVKQYSTFSVFTSSKHEESWEKFGTVMRTLEYYVSDLHQPRSQGFSLSPGNEVGICITLQNSPNPLPSVKMRLCKHGKVPYCFYNIIRKNTRQSKTS